MSRPNLADPAYHRELLAAELQLNARGIWTIPLRLATADNGEHKWQPAVRAPYTLANGLPTHVTAEQVRARRTKHPAAGIGIVCGPQPCGRSLIAIDEDVEGAYAALAAQNGETITDTWRQQTRRAWHYLYWLTEYQSLVADLAIRNIKIADGTIDVRAHHSYVVGAPTCHRVLDGTRYIEHWREPAELPEWIFRIIRERSIRIIPDRSDERDLDDAIIERDYPYASRLYRGQRLCETHAPAVQGNDGSGTAMWLAGALVQGLVIRRDDAIKLMRDVYSPRCLPPWSDGEIERMIDNAIAAPRRAKGWLLAESHDQVEEGQPVCGAPDPAALVRAEIVGVDEVRGAVWYAIAEGPHAGQQRRRPMAWPPTPQSKQLWDALARAIGVDVITRPHAQLWQQIVRVEIVEDRTGAYAWRLGRVYAVDDANRIEAAHL